MLDLLLLNQLTPELESNKNSKILTDMDYRPSTLNKRADVQLLICKIFKHVLHESINLCTLIDKLIVHYDIHLRDSNRLFLIHV